MAIKVVLQVDGSADWIAADATASFRLDRDTTSAFAAPTEVATTSLSTGVERYETWDASGAATSWYRFRIEDDSDVALSGWSDPFQVLATQDIANLATVKLRLGSNASAADDDILESYIDAANGAIIQRIGYYPGPSTDTSRVYHGMYATKDQTRLRIPGGVRTVSALTIALNTGGSQTAATAGAWVLGPNVHALRTGEPYQYLQMVDVPTGAWSTFPAGYDNVTITGTFGWEVVPPDLVAIASAWAIRQWKSRAAGDADILGTTEFGEQIVSDRFPAQWRRAIDQYRLDALVS
jgi:hypothetical protein